MDGEGDDKANKATIANIQIELRREQGRFISFLPFWPAGPSGSNLKPRPAAALWGGSRSRPGKSPARDHQSSRLSLRGGLTELVSATTRRLRVNKTAAFPPASKQGPSP
jgi:hypothetical protein